MEHNSVLLAVDIGNTGITLGVFDNEIIKEEFHFSSKLSNYEYDRIFSDISKKYSITNCLISSVVKELNDTITLCASENLHIKTKLISAQDLNKLIKNITKEPDMTGTDRLVNVYSASKLYSKAPIIVIDAGTATTFDILNSYGEFAGGIIMPGVRMQLESLYHNTSLLPEIEPEYIKNAIGIDTKTSILSGVVMAHAYSVKGLLNKCEQELKQKPFVVLTGGYANLLSEYLQGNYDTLNPNLTLQGIALLANVF